MQLSLHKELQETQKQHEKEVKRVGEGVTFPSVPALKWKNTYNCCKVVTRTSVCLFTIKVFYSQLCVEELSDILLLLNIIKSISSDLLKSINVF